MPSRRSAFSAARLDRTARNPARKQAGLLQVVADDLEELVAGCREAREPVDEADVQLGAAPLRQPFVGDVPDQDVLERVLAVAGNRGLGVRADEISALERREAVADLTLHALEV